MASTQQDQSEIEKDQSEIKKDQSEKHEPKESTEIPMESERARLDTPIDDGAETTAGAQENHATKAADPTAKTWKQYQEHSDRMDAAIERASAVMGDLTGQTESSQKNEDRFKTVNISFEGSQWYRIPMEACCTWKRMEMLIKTWLQDDKEALKDFEQGHFTLKDVDDLLLPRFWEKLISQGANISFSRSTPPEGDFKSQSTASDPNPEADEKLVQTEYESKLRYTVHYVDEDLDLEAVSVYDEPLGFEVESLNETLAALEEIQEIISPRHENPRQKGRKHGKIRLHPSDRIGNKKLKINSPFLLNVIRSVVTYSSASPKENDTGLTSGIFKYPYKDLCLHMDALQDYRTQKSELRARHSAGFNSKFDEHMDLLQNYLDHQPGVLLKETKAKWDRPNPRTSFASIWLLLKPGSDVYVREDDGSLSAYIVDAVKDGVTFADDGRRTIVKYQVQVWHLVLASNVIKAWTREIDIDVFDDDRDITSLPVFPTRFKDDVDGGVTREALIKRGRKYFKYSRRPTFLQYSGPGLKGGKIYKRARVVVEHASQPWRDEEFESPQCQANSPFDDEDFGLSIRIARCECQECKEVVTANTLRFSDYRLIETDLPGELTPHQYMLMTSHMFGFILKDRKYDLLDVAFLEDPVMAETAIDKLVMEPGNKEIIKAIAKIYTDEAPQGRFSADFISGKGEGQIILLHGPPGTGKTLTAESVAEYTKRPLLNITAADLGHQPDALERSLLRYFRRAADWDAIVLLDEADVYLEQRSIEDLTRNSIVSVFLRALDYFQGILFLTTNRVAQFDEAFASRIHLSLGYDKLDNKARVQIWDNLFQKLRDDHRRNLGPEIDFGISVKQYVKTQEVMALEWNGREIRNAFQTAVALAVYDSKQPNGGGVPYLTETHLEQVVAMSSAFREYMKKARQNMTESEYAAFRNNRYDKDSNK